MDRSESADGLVGDSLLNGFDENFGGSDGAECRRWAAIGMDHHRTRMWVALFDDEIRAGGQAATFHELEEGGVLVQHAGDAQWLIDRAIRQAGDGRWAQVSVGERDRIAVRIDTWPAEQRVDLLHHLVADGVLELLGLGVNFAPVQADYFHQEQLDETMAAKDVQRELF